VGVYTRKFLAIIDAMLKGKLALIAGIFILVVLGGGVGFYLYRDAVSRPGGEKKTDVPTSGEATSTVALAPSIPAPKLSGPLVVTAKLSPEDAAKAKDIILKTRESLIAAGDQLTAEVRDEWVQLGVYYKLIGDYRGAEEVWQYVTARFSNDAVAFNNLANLYLSELPDNTKAGYNYLQAIEKEPSNYNYYYNAYAFFRFVMKDTVQAKNILRSAAATLPAYAAEAQRLIESF